MQTNSETEVRTTAGKRIGGVTTEWLVVLAIAAFVILVRSPSFPPSVIDPDESMFSLMGRELLHGHLPYVAIFDIKPFGLPAAFALAMAVAGQSVFAARLLGTVCIITTALLLRRTALVIGMRAGPAFALAILYAAFSTQMDGLATTTEVLLAPFTTAGIFLAFKGRYHAQFRQQLWTIASVGACFGLAIWIKYLPALTASLTFAALNLWWLGTRRAHFLRACAFAVPFAITCALPTVITALLYLLLGHWQEFWFANFGFMVGYAGQGAPLHGIRLVAQRAVVELWPLLGLALAGCYLALRHQSPDGDRTGIIGAMLWLTAELVAAIMPMHFFPHYFLLVLPPLALLAGFALQHLVTAWVQPAVRTMAAPVVALCIALLPIFAMAQDLTRDWLNLGGPDATRRIAALIRSDPDPHPTAWVMSRDPIILYLEARLPLPTRYAFAADLTDEWGWISHAAQMTEVQRILGNHPTFLVLDRHNWPEVRPEMQTVIEDTIARDYRQVGEATGGKFDLILYRRRVSPTAK